MNGLRIRRCAGRNLDSRERGGGRGWNPGFATTHCLAALDPEASLSASSKGGWFFGKYASIRDHFQFELWTADRYESSYCSPNGLFSPDLWTPPNCTVLETPIVSSLLMSSGGTKHGRFSRMGESLQIF